jgi:hypothetical protein
MMLRRLSILGSLLLAACVPFQGPSLAPSSAASCYNKVPTNAEAMAWRSALRVNTDKSYRGFINNYPRSCYVPMATKKLATAVTRKPVVVRSVPRSTRTTRTGIRAY